MLTEKELLLSVGGAPSEPIHIRRDGQQRLDVEPLKKLLEAQKAPPETPITVHAEDAVRYEDLVRVIDTCIAAGLANVSVASTG